MSGADFQIQRDGSREEAESAGTKHDHPIDRLRVTRRRRWSDLYYSCALNSRFAWQLFPYVHRIRARRFHRNTFPYSVQEIFRERHARKAPVPRRDRNDGDTRHRRKRRKRSAGTSFERAHRWSVRLHVQRVRTVVGSGHLSHVRVGRGALR